MSIALAADGTQIYYVTHGDATRPSVFLGPHCFASPNELLPTGVADPTPAWVDAIAGDFHVIVADYPRGMGRTGNALGRAYTPDVAVGDLVAIIDAVGVTQVAWVGYSYGGAVGVQLACRSNRLSALVIGGWPPLNQPFAEMVDVATAAATAGDPATTVDPAFLWSSVGFYSGLVDWPERAEVSRLDLPRTVFMGSEDETGEVPLAARLRDAEADLIGMGWDVRWLDGHDHMSAMTAETAAPLVCDFLLRPLHR